jgi:hypothetical protein
VFKFISTKSKAIAALLSLVMLSGVYSMGGAASAADLKPPFITTVSPTTGTVTGGETITVTGSNLQYVTGGAIGTNPIDFLHWVQVDPAGTWLTFEAPYSTTTGKMDLTLYGWQNNITQPQVYTYTPTSITSITPNLGSILGGTPVVIKGVGFGPMEWGDGSLNVTIGGVAATNVVRVSPTEIKATTPTGVVGQQDVVVGFNNGRYLTYSRNTITGSKIFTYGPANVAPVITTISPNKGSTAGGTNVKHHRPVSSRPKQRQRHLHVRWFTGNRGQCRS